MNHIFISALLLQPLVMAYSPLPETPPPTPEQAEHARMSYEALSLLLRAHRALQQEERHAPMDPAEFYRAFAEQLKSHAPLPQERFELFRAQKNELLYRKLQETDFAAQHAAQQGVTVLPNGLQYDVFSLPSPADNYKARRAHCIHAYIPGTNISIQLYNTPLTVREALSSAPDGVAWRFLVPLQAIDGADASRLKTMGLRYIELLAYRAEPSPLTLQEIHSYFTLKHPPLSNPAELPAELHTEQTILAGIRAAGNSSDHSDEFTELILLYLPRLVHADDATIRDLEAAQNKAEAHYRDVEKRLLLHRQKSIGDDIINTQKQLPGTMVLGNGILCRVTKADYPANVLQASYIEEEVLGAEQYFRVRDRIISVEHDIPEQIRQVADSVPPGTAWEFIIPASLRGNHAVLPIRYRLRTTLPAPTAPSIIPAGTL